MNCNIVLSGPIIRYTNFQKEVALTADTPQTALRQLVDIHPKLEDVLFKEGDWNNSVTIYCDNKRQDFADMATVADPCQLHLVVPLVGG
jgi:hypothetical protein